jgi:hypothetical protein
VRLCVAKISIESSFLKDSDLKSIRRDFYFSVSRVMESCKFMRERSGRVIMCAGY